MSFIKLDKLVLTSACGAMLALAATANAETTYDNSNSSQWWFDAQNWSANTVPPGNADPTAVTDTSIRIETGFTGDLGEGVVYDPTNDPNFAAAQALVYPTGFGPKAIQILSISRAASQPALPAPQNPALVNQLLTIKGDLSMTQGQIGRSSGVAGSFANARINQISGTVIDTSTMDIAGTDTSRPGKANAIYDYRGGTLEVSPIATTALRISHGSSSNNTATSLPTGASGIGRLIIHNPATPGHIRVGRADFASYAGIADTTDGGLTASDPDGVTTGVAIAEFSIDNGATRPLQITGNLSINNGLMATTSGTRSSRLALSITGAVAAPGGIPENLGLFDVDFDNPAIADDDFTVGIIQGSGTMGGTFSSADGLTQLTEGMPVSATFGGTKYNWTISYRGVITWSDVSTGALSSVTAGVVGDKDIVLLGQSIETVAVPDSGNFNGDARVDGTDFLTWQKNKGTGNLFSQGDANHNGTIDGVDLGIWKSQYGTAGSVGAVTGVPEPASAALVAFAGLSLAAIRRRK